MKLPRLFVLALLAPLACAQATRPATAPRPAFYYDLNATMFFNGGMPQWGRASKAVAGIEGMRPLLVITSGPMNNFNTNEVKKYAAAWAGSDVPVVMDDEQKGFAFWIISPPADLDKAIKNHLNWNKAWREGNPKARIGHWNVIPPPWGSTDRDILKGLDAYEKKCAPLIAVNDFACFDGYAYNGVTEEEWTRNVIGTIPRAKKFAKPVIVGLCPFVANTGQTLPAARFDRMIQGCADAGVEGIFIFTGLADLSAVGEENMAVIRKWARR
jgi:hypothetical protein